MRRRRYHHPVSTDRLQTLLEDAFPDASEVRVIDRGLLRHRRVEQRDQLDERQRDLEEREARLEQREMDITRYVTSVQERFTAA